MIKSNAHKIYFLVFTALLLLALCLVAMHLGAVKFSVAKGFALFLSFAFDKNKTILMLILGGIICSSFFSAGVSALKILADPYNTLPNIVFWLMGSLAYIQKLPLLFVAVVFVAIFVLSVLLSRQIDILNLDEESAKSLGISVKKCEFFSLSLLPCWRVQAWH